ncbi:MAG: response regulator transcription factor [Chitinophagaceae bacterium]|nr:MAG: response regulator transcription factor [Chitinophagaceae bacterium]
MSPEETKPIRLLIADDHEIFRDGFRVMLKKNPAIELVGEAADGESLLGMVALTKPDVVITDIRMPGLDGIAVTRALQHQAPDLPVIGLSTYDEEQVIVDMLEAGARGYLLKNASKEEIYTAVDAVHRGEIYFCSSTSPRLAELIARSSYNPFRRRPSAEISDREREIIRLICQEFSSKEIALQLHNSVRTVESYRDRLLDKIGARNVAGLVVYAIKNGIYKP